MSGNAFNPFPNKSWARIHQPFSRTFFVFFSKICKFECNTTVLHSNASEYRIICRTRPRTFLRMVGEYGPRFLCVCSTSFLKTLREKEKFLVTSNFSFPHSVFYLFRELPAIFNKSEIVV